MNIFVCLTPYHVLLSYLGTDFRGGDRILFLDERRIGLRAVPLANTRPEQIHYIGLTPGRWGTLKHFSRISINGKVAKKIRNLASKSYEKVFFFNDRSPSAQFFLSLTAPKEFIYMEDGSAAYRSHSFSTSNWKKLIFWMLLRFQYRHISTMGGSGYARRAKFLYPEKVNECMMLPTSQYELQDDFQRRAAVLTDSLPSVFSDPFRRRSILILLPFRFSDLATRKKWGRFIDSLLVNDLDVELYIKPHPLAADITPVPGPRITMLDSSIPAELLVVLQEFEEIFVEPSTAIHSIKFFGSNAKLTAVIHDQQKFFTDKKRFLDLFDVTAIRNID